MLSNAAHADPAMTGQLDYELIENQFYPTPPENVDVLATFVDLGHYTVWEPACGEGHISKRLQRYCAGVISTDLIDRGYGHGGIDFLKAGRMAGKSNAIITNPPYGELADEFLAAALELTAPVDGLVAMFLRNEWDCGDKRTAKFFEHPAFAMKIVVTKRPRWIEGSKGSPRHNFSWFVWDWRNRGAPASIHHLHPKNARPIERGTIH
jgi:hypothetical protein